MAKPNSNDRIASSQITRSSLDYIKLQFGGQRGEHSARQSKKAPVVQAGAKTMSQTICKPTAWFGGTTRPDGLVTPYHARTTAPAEKTPQAFGGGGWGRRTAMGGVRPHLEPGQ
jgi:hypothetical protein